MCRHAVLERTWQYSSCRTRARSQLQFLNSTEVSLGQWLPTPCPPGVLVYNTQGQIPKKTASVGCGHLALTADIKVTWFTCTPRHVQARTRRENDHSRKRESCITCTLPALLVFSLQDVACTCVLLLLSITQKCLRSIM